jgi:hypothetical protein
MIKQSRRDRKINSIRSTISPETDAVALNHLDRYLASRNELLEYATKLPPTQRYITNTILLIIDINEGRTHL